MLSLANDGSGSHRDGARAADGIAANFFGQSSYNGVEIKYFSVPAGNALARHASERRDGGYLRLLGTWR